MLLELQSLPRGSLPWASPSIHLLPSLPPSPPPHPNLCSQPRSLWPGSQSPGRAVAPGWSFGSRGEAKGNLSSKDIGRLQGLVQLQQRSGWTRDIFVCAHQEPLTPGGLLTLPILSFTSEGGPYSSEAQAVGDQSPPTSEGGRDMELKVRAVIRPKLDGAPSPPRKGQRFCRDCALGGGMQRRRWSMIVWAVGISP